MFLRIPDTFIGVVVLAVHFLNNADNESFSEHFVVFSCKQDYRDCWVKANFLSTGAICNLRKCQKKQKR